MNGRVWALTALAMFLVPAAARAQQNFFNNRGVALYSPIVDVVNSGARLVVTPTVSADRKYVTMSMQPQVSQLIKLENFPVATGNNLGNVGGVPAPQGPVPQNAPQDANGGRPGPVQRGGQGNNLQRMGMTMLAGPG